MKTNLTAKQNNKAYFFSPDKVVQNNLYGKGIIG